MAMHALSLKHAHLFDHYGYSSNFLIAAQSTPERHLVNSQLIVGQMSTDSYTSIEN